MALTTTVPTHWEIHQHRVVCFREGSRLEEHLVEFIPGHQKDLFVLRPRAFWVVWYDEKYSLALTVRPVTSEMQE